MFGTYFKSSLKALPWLVLLPALAFTAFALFVDTVLVEDGIIFAMDPEWYQDEGGYGRSLMMRSMIIAIVANFLFLMIIPPAIGGINAGTKQKQFYLGFFVNLALMLLLPIYAFMRFGLDPLTFAIIIGLHLISLPVPFILGARCVAPAYRRAFWFALQD